MAEVVRRIDGTALLLASLAAPGSSFLIWGVWSLVTGGPGAAGAGEQLLGMALMLVLISVWGAIPAAAFGTPILLLVKRLFSGDPPLWALILAGMTAAGLYAVCSAGLASAGQGWIFLAAPWTSGFLSPEEGGLHPIAPMITAIVLSGAVGGLTYWREEKRRSAPSRPSPLGGEGGPEGLG